MLTVLAIGGSAVEYDPEAGRARLSVPPTPARRYTNAQLDDYHGFGDHRPGRPRFSSAPPMRVSLRARASQTAPIGTLGFGFWNEPFSMTGSLLGTPSVLWFFYASPPSDMAVVPGVPGRGWKAASLKTRRWPGLLFAPAALSAVLLSQVPGLGRPVMNLARRFMTAYEAPLSDVALDAWHDYEIEWRAAEARFRVDGAERLHSPTPPAGPLGFVLWLDNQYAIASESGQFGFGVRPLLEEQWLEVENLHFEALTAPAS